MDVLSFFTHGQSGVQEGSGRRTGDRGDQSLQQQQQQQRGSHGSYARMRRDTHDADHVASPSPFDYIRQRRPMGLGLSEERSSSSRSPSRQLELTYPKSRYSTSGAVLIDQGPPIYINTNRANAFRGAGGEEDVENLRYDDDTSRIGSGSRISVGNSYRSSPPLQMHLRDRFGSTVRYGGVPMANEDEPVGLRASPQPRSVVREIRLRHQHRPEAQQGNEQSPSYDVKAHLLEDMLRDGTLASSSPARRETGIAATSDAADNVSSSPPTVLPAGFVCIRWACIACPLNDDLLLPVSNSVVLYCPQCGLRQP